MGGCGRRAGKRNTGFHTRREPPVQGPRRGKLRQYLIAIAATTAIKPHAIRIIHIIHIIHIIRVIPTV